jgi:pyruvate dehydrogenase E2 component (dihydrolipoamide acetyltransferase)
MDLESPVAGRLGPHLFEPGAIVPVGTVIVEILIDGEEAAAPPPVEAARAGQVPAEGVTHATTLAFVPGSTVGRRPHTKSPRARRLARDGGGDATSRSDRFRDLIAAKVSESWRQIPHFAVTREADAESMLRTLNTLRASGLEPAPTLTDLLVRALALALLEVGAGPPGAVGLAVATSHGVAIPVLRGVLGLDAAELARARAAAVERARSGRLDREDIDTTPPSTLSNLGASGVDQFTGLIALGQTSLLTVGRAVRRPVVDTDGTLTARTTFHATLNADHRALDGADAARLLVAFTGAAETITPDFSKPR